MEYKKYVFALASQKDRDHIYGLRYDIYADELQQHPLNTSRRLTDLLDEGNVYIVAKINDNIAGFVSITPPGFGKYSIDKYFSRDTLPFAIDAGLYEVRLLSVVGSHRRSLIAGLLIYAAFRWIEEHGGTRIVAIGRKEILDLYFKVGLKTLGRQTVSGAVIYELITETIDNLRSHAKQYLPELDKVRERIDWQLPMEFVKGDTCFHGGAFFKAIGEEFDDLDRRHDIINADVLDAWYPPSPRVIEALQKHLPWIIRTSPPTNCDGMVNAIARCRNVGVACVLPGGGSSDLIFLALRHFLNSKSRVLILDPTYGEYQYLLKEVIGCRMDRFVLSRDDEYVVDLAQLKDRICKEHYDMVVLVNPNSPTGRFISKAGLERFLAELPTDTLVWIDETYIEYAGNGQSLEQFAAGSENVIVCKSMSKVYALSGLRSAYLCASPKIIRVLKRISPPWAVSLPAQIAAVMAMQDSEYYENKYRETHNLRKNLAEQLGSQLKLDVTSGVANFLLCHLPENGQNAREVIDRCKLYGLFLRDVSTMGTEVGRHAFRISVKDERTNQKMINILKETLDSQYIQDGTLLAQFDS
jgi:histidinol-phosphate/aromatic aminotransferase/cobyric acid decarboxylase-like protein